MSKKSRNEIEKFCFGKVKHIIDKLKPKMILILGIKTFDILKEKGVLAYIQNEEIFYDRKFNRTRIAISAQSGRCKLFAIIHPTGARISKEDRDSVRNIFLNKLL